MPDLPTGTLTLLFTDIEGSSTLLRKLGPKAYADALAEHRRVVRKALATHAGTEVDTQGDAFFVVFTSAPSALAAAEKITSELEPGQVRVRIGIHSGTPLRTTDGYVGEAVHVAARIAAAGHGGQVLASGATAALVPPDATSPLRELGEHRLKDIDGPVQILQLGEGSFPPLRTVANTNLPRPASSFIGRAHERDEVLRQLADGARLVTLTGPGGSGKSRLALEVAAARVGDHAAGVFWIDLSPVRDAALVTATIAVMLGARDGLAEHIGSRELLLLLDNFEQVVAAAPELTPVLTACPHLTLLVTSRERLRIQGEVEYAVPPLAESEAVALFCERAQLEASDVVAELCRRLDLLPLAVELAAARTAALTPEQIIARLSQRLDLLRGGRDADPRQQTLRATIDWSYELLSDAERALLRRLSVFSGGCTLEAAESVAEAELSILESLVEKSLVRFSGGRYTLLETIREFAGERLEPDEQDAARRRLRAFVAALAEASASELHTAGEGSTSAALAPEYPNIRAAVTYALDASEPDDTGRIVGAIYPFLVSHGNLAEVIQWVTAALDQRDRMSPHGLAEALAGGGEIARFAGDLDLATALKEELIGLEVDLARPNWRAATLADLCEIALDRDDIPRALRYAEESAAAGGGARVALCFAEVALRQGDLAAAEAHGRTALDGFEEGSYNHACVLELLAEAARRAGEASLATERFSESLRSFARIGDGGGIADCLDGLARVAVDAGALERAARLRGAAQNLRDTRGRRPIRADLAFPDVPAAAEAEGRALPLDVAIEEALEP